MRTAIFLGLMAIADAINKDWITNEDTMKFLAIVAVIMIIMDIVEFIKKMQNKTS